MEYVLYKRKSGESIMVSARIFILLVSLIKLIYDFVIAKIADKQRQKPLPEEVSDIYDKDRYQTYLNYVSDSKKLSNKHALITLIIDVIFIFSPIYTYIEVGCNSNPYLTYLALYSVLTVVSTITGTWYSYVDTFTIEEKYGRNKMDLKEFIKDTVLDNGFSIFLMIVLGEGIVFIGEHMAIWTNDFTIGLIGSILVCLGIFVAIFAFVQVMKFISYVVLKKQYDFTPLEEGDLKDKINKLQESSKKKVKYIYVYNESKKTTTKNAFLLKLFWHREFGIADNFMNENAEDELLAVLSHEIGHLKHKKNILNYLNYVGVGLIFVLTAILLYNPSLCLTINAWIRDSFSITTNNYYLIMLVYMGLYTPISYLIGLFNTFRSRQEEYEADREAVKNGYGEPLIKLFKDLSRDELVNVNPHPFIEFTEYDHPGMYQRIKAIRREENR